MHRHAKVGRIPSVRLGGPDGPLRFIPDDAEHWLERARSDWLPGDTAKAVSRRAARTVAVRTAQMTIDELAGKT